MVNKLLMTLILLKGKIISHFLILLRGRELEIMGRLREYMVEQTGMFEDYLMERVNEEEPVE